LLRTDDIKGAKPKTYGNPIPQVYAGNHSGLTKTYKNESDDILNH